LWKSVKGAVNGKRVAVSSSPLDDRVYTPNAGYAELRFLLAWPLACEPGATCFVQNYVDHDPSDGTLDFRCGDRTNDGHDGTDIRLADLDIQRKRVEVLTAVSGQVAHARDGMEDVSVKLIGKAAIAGRECGNGDNPN
jgi:hypothetical protein